MTDVESVAFLQWALPQLGRRWAGYRKIRRRVCRQISRRAGELGLGPLGEYRRMLEHDPEEWARLDELLDVTISRLYRDRAVFDFVRAQVMPALVERAQQAGNPVLRVWSAGCANGEEPYTLAIMWELEIAPTAGGLRLAVMATDIKASVLERAARGRYPRSSMRDLPTEWRNAAFSVESDDEGEELALLPRFRRDVVFAQHDIRDCPPDGPFDLVVCRYQAFTYFDDGGQRDTAAKVARVTGPGAVLVLGSREQLPDDSGFEAWVPRLGVFRRSGEGAEAGDGKDLVDASDS